MKILYIAYFFPPSRAVAARRFRHLASVRFADAEAQFVVTQPGGATDLPMVEVSTVEAGDFRQLIRGKDKEANTVSADRKQKWASVLRLRQAYPFLYLTDDGGPQYRSQAFLKASELIEKHGITTVFSSFRPWSDHLVARKLKKKYPDLNWIADFRDLPADPVRKDVWWPALQNWWGRRVVASADEMWVVSEGQRAQFEGWHTNIKVRRNAMLKLPPERTAPQTDRFTIVYTGSLYSGLQTVEPLVRALHKMLAAGALATDKLRLVYRGKDAALFRQWARVLPDACLDIEPSIAPAAAQKMQQNAQVLLLLNWSAPNYYGVLTAKLWDYLAAGRPILALVNGPGDEELKNIVEGANAGAVFANEEQRKLEKWLNEKHVCWLENGELPWSPDRQKMTTYL